MYIYFSSFRPLFLAKRFRFHGIIRLQWPRAATRWAGDLNDVIVDVQFDNLHNHRENSTPLLPKSEVGPERTEAAVGRIDGINIAALLTGCRCWAAVRCDLRTNKKQAAWEKNNDEDFITPLLCVSRFNSCGDRSPYMQTVPLLSMDWHSPAYGRRRLHTYALNCRTSHAFWAHCSTVLRV